MTRDLFEETIEEHGTPEQREAYAELVERFGKDFRTDNGAVLFQTAIPVGQDRDG
jgi:hypothetical protein